MIRCYGIPASKLREVKSLETCSGDQILLWLKDNAPKRAKIKVYAKDGVHVYRSKK